MTFAASRGLPRRLGLAALVGVLIATTISPAAHAVDQPGIGQEAAKTPAFSDIAGTEHQAAIEWLAAQGLTKGFPDGTYRPLGSVNRDAMAAFLYRLAGEPAFTAPAQSPFADVTPTTQFYKEMAWMNAEGIAKGFEDGSYRPLSPVNRDAMAAFMNRFTGEYCNIPAASAFAQPTTAPFSDVPVSLQFSREIAWMKDSGVSRGWTEANGTTTYRPLLPVARDAMAAFIQRLDAMSAANGGCKPWMDVDLAANQRADLLLAEMTLEEKVSRLHGEYSGETAFYIAPLERLGIPALLMTDAGSGVRVTNSATNAGKATALPAPLALGATWDTSLASEYGNVLGAETRATGQNGLLGPSGDLVRDARWGRAFESLGEDPRLASQLVAAEVDAVQAHDVVATIKHPAAYMQEKSRLSGGNVDVTERALREVYLAPVEAAIKAGVGSAMCSFNKVNNVFACESSEVFDILKEDYGFPGFIQSDYGATHSTVPAANSGLDVEFPAANFFGQALIDAVNRGDVSLATIDDKAHRVLRTMFEFGSFDTPTGVTALDAAAGSAVAQEVAEEGTVLLKNAAAVGTTAHALPLDAAAISSLAVIGADADALATGGGSSVVKPTNVSTPLDAIVARAGTGVNVTYAEGTDPVGPAHSLSGAAVPSSVLAPAGDPQASGIRAQYWFNGADPAGAPTVTRVEDQVAMSAGFLALNGLYGSSVPVIPGYPFGGPLTARWTGTITAPADGGYKLSLTGFGSARLFLDGQEIISAADPHAVRTDTSALLQLKKGEAHELRVEYSNNASDPDQESAADLVMTWEHPEDIIVPAVAEAVAAAKASDVAVVFARDYVGEGRDKATLTLANEQDALIKAVAAANPRTVVVLTTSGSVNMPWLGNVPAVLEAWYGGQEQGAAIARVLFGDVNPSGKLPVTFATGDAATPTSDPALFPGQNRTSVIREDINIGYRGYRAAGITPQFAFGHGLSYTSFAYSNLDVASTGTTVAADGEAKVRITVDVANSGIRAGTETVQVYLGTLPTAFTTPQRQLAGFAKVDLAASSSRTVTIDLDPRAFSYWDAATNKWVTPTGEVPVYVGTSSSEATLQDSVAIR